MIFLVTLQAGLDAKKFTLRTAQNQSGSRISGTRQKTGRGRKDSLHQILNNRKSKKYGLSPNQTNPKFF